MNSLENVGDGIVDFVVFLVVALPYFLPLIILAVVIIVIIKVASKKKKKKTPPPAEPNAP